MKKDNNKQEAPAQASIAVPNIKKEGLKGFYRSVMREMKQVNWPEIYESNRLTGVVLAICIIATSLLFVLSVLFNILHAFLLKGG